MAGEPKIFLSASDFCSKRLGLRPWLFSLAAPAPVFFSRGSKAAGPAYYVLHPQKGITICLFLTYQAFKNREGIVSQTNLAE